MKKSGNHRSLVSTCIFAVLVSLAGNAIAHHSAIAFDRNAPLVTVTGKVTQFIWRSPHTSINMEVENADGVIEIWKLEGGGTVSLVRSGITRESIKPGQIISVTAMPLRDKGPGGLTQAITPEDGRVIDFSND